MTPLVVAVVVSLPFLLILAFRPLQRRLAVRNARRRPIEAMLVIAGTLLGTAIITGSLIVGDTIDRSIRASAYDQLGPIDETIAVSGADLSARLRDTLAGFDHPDIDGILPFDVASAAVAGRGGESGAPRLVRPRAQVLEVDFADARRFGGDPEATGISGSTPRAGRAAITSDLARRIGVGVGDRVTIYAYDQSLPLVVDRVLERRGVAGYWQVDPGRSSFNVFVTPGTLAALYAGLPAEASATVEPPRSVMAVSNVGGVEDGVPRTDRVRRALTATLAGAGVEARVVPEKRDLIDDAVESSKALSELYFTVGMFAVAAGVLLLVNIFVMLADDRRSELGMIRALGLRRMPLVTTFATEGWCYAVVASALGALLGIGVGRVIAWRADQILSTGREIDVIDMRFAFDRTTIVAGFAIGLVISLVTIVLTSIRTARINVIAAIRNLPDVKPQKQSRRRTGLGLAAVLLGTGLTVLGFGAPDGFALILGPSLVALGAGVLLSGHVPSRTLTSALCLFVFVWCTASVPIGASLGAALDIPLFFVQGVLMSAAAITFVVAQEDRVARFLARVSGDALPIRMGLAYPLARRFRTAMTLGMFSIVVLTLVFMSQLVSMFDSQSADLTRKLSGGFGGVVTSNPSNPIPPGALDGVQGIDRVAPMAYLYAAMTRPGAEPVDWPLSGFGPELVAAPPVLEDRGTYPSDRAAWEAVRTDPSLIIADEFFATPPGGPPTKSLEVGDHVVVQDPVTGVRRILTVAAVSTDDYLASGAYMGIDGMREIFGTRAVPSRYFVGGDDVQGEVQRVRRAFMANGADGDTVRGLIDVLFSQNNAFFTLMQQFVAVGLVVGIAGIGVIMVRAVRERRRQVGVLRALGFGKRTVAWSFIVEASFVAVSGTLMGVGIALIATWGLTTSDASWAEGLQYGVAWQDIVLIVGLAVLAALAAAVLPARAASDIQPAVALRLAD